MIGFAAPLFAGLLAAIGLIWFLHSRREHRVTVPSLMLWRLLQDQAGLQPKARLIPPITWPLILQLLAAALLVGALTQPFWGGRPAPDHLVVVLDTSAAMQARTEEGTLFAQALDRLDAALGSRDRLTPGRLSLIAADAAPRYVAARWPWEPGVLDEALARVSPTDGASDTTALARLIPGILGADEATEILYVSTAPAPEVVRNAAAGAQWTEILLASTGPDAGLAGRLEPVDPQAGLWRLDGEVLFRDARESVTVGIQYASDISRTPLDWASVTVQNPQSAPARIAFSQEIELPGPGIVTAVIGNDATPRDNRLRFVAGDAADTLDILYVGEGNQPLLRALAAIDGVALYRDDAVGEAASNFDLVVIDQIEAAEIPATNAIVIAPQTEALADPDPDFWDSAHPLARNIDWPALAIEAAGGIDAPQEASVLVSADGAALVAARAGETGRIVYLGFDPARSNWPETAGLPLFVANLVDWMGRSPGAVSPASCRVGEPCMIDARLAGQSIVNLETPQASPRRVPEGTFVPEEAGLFLIGQGELTRLLAVNPVPAPLAAGPVDAPAEGAGYPCSLGLWLLGAALALLLMEAVLTARRQGWLPRVPVLRILALLLAVAGLFDLPWPWLGSRSGVVLILPDEAAADEVPGSPTIAGLVAGPALRVVADAGAPFAARPEAMRVTHAAQALDLAAALVPPGREATIVLGGDMQRDRAAERSFAARGLVVDYLAPPALADTEVYLSRLDLPSQVFPDDAVPLTALAHSGAARTVSMEIVSDGVVVAAREIELAQGANRIETVLPAIATGESLIEMRIAAGDPFPQNDSIGQIVRTAPLRPIAVVAADPAHGEAFAGLLAGQGLEAEVIEPRRAPYYIEGWLDFGGIVLVNTPALALATLQQTLIETAVAEHGLGLVILGGPGAYGPGGYFGTPLEALSPLSSRVPQDAPEVAMVFVLDRSGSMQQPVGDSNRLDVAKKATVAATELLNPQSQVGIVVFDAEARTLLPLTRLSDDPSAVQTALEGFDPGGGTSIYPGLVEALDLMAGIDAPAKHIVVMTDGLSQPGDFPGIVSRLRAAGITVSAVAIGQGADTNIARTIAELGGGSAHVTSDFEALPSILSQEAMLFASPVQEGVTQPVWADRTASFLSALPAQLPPLTGFVGTTAKPDADLVATAPDEEGRDMPILAYWRYGNGMVLALSTDATGPWSEAWQRLPAYGALWSDILRRFQPATPSPGFTLSVEGDGEYLNMEVSALDAQGLPLSGETLVAMVVAPGASDAEETLLSEIRPGLYAGRRVLDAVGRYDLTIDRGAEAEPVEAAYYHPYDPRYDFSRLGGAEALARMTGGRAIAPGDIPALGGGLAPDWRHFWPAWALLAFIVFLIDLTVRYRRVPARLGAAAVDAGPQGLRKGA